MKIYYSVKDGGDGSAYPEFFDSDELADWHQEHLDEGWGEPCTGVLEVEGDNITCAEARCKEAYYLELLDDRNDNIEEFKADFFPDGVPKFEVVLLENPKYYGVKIQGEDRIVFKKFSYPGNTSEEGRIKLEKSLTS